MEQAAEQQAERARALELENQKLAEERDLARREWEREREAAEEALRISQAKLDEATLAHEEYTHRAMAEMERYRQQVEDERLDVEEHIKASVSEQTERQRAALTQAHDVLVRKHEAALKDFAAVRKDFELETENLRRLHSAKIARLEAEHKQHCKDIAQKAQLRLQEQATAHENAIQLQNQLHETAMLVDGASGASKSSSMTSAKSQFLLASAQTEARHFQDECTRLETEKKTLQMELSQAAARAEREVRALNLTHQQEMATAEERRAAAARAEHEDLLSARADADAQLLAAHSLLDTEREAHAQSVMRPPVLLSVKQPSMSGH